MEDLVSSTQFLEYFERAHAAGIHTDLLEGRLSKIVGLTLEAQGCRGSIGARYKIEKNHNEFLEAELVGFKNDVSYLLTLDRADGLVSSARVIPMSTNSTIGVGDALLGRVVNARNQPIDGGANLNFHVQYPLHGRKINPLQRELIDEPLDVGVRVINGLFTIGKGQRVGLFAGTGVGKSILLGMITKSTAADVVVVGLIGERGREVREFVDKTLGEKGLKKSVVVATPADDSPLLRYQGALTAMTIAEYFRDEGKDVLLIMDSLTRFSHAQREIGLSIGEPPANRGYPPSVVAKLSSLVERAGNVSNGGSITAIFTVLTEGDDFNDPIADASRGILDGHIILSRELSDLGIYPAVSVLSSVSRIMNDIIVDDHKQASALFKKYYAIYKQHEDLISIGAYKKGSIAEVDRAIELFEPFKEYIQQLPDESISFSDSVEKLNLLFK